MNSPSGTTGSARARRSSSTTAAAAEPALRGLAAFDGTGTTPYGNGVLRVPAAHKDGRAGSSALPVAMLFDESRKVDAVVAIIRDETARFNEDRALRQRIVELEGQLAAPR